MTLPRYTITLTDEQAARLIPALTERDPGLPIAAVMRRALEAYVSASDDLRCAPMRSEIIGAAYPSHARARSDQLRNNKKNNNNYYHDGMENVRDLTSELVSIVNSHTKQRQSKSGGEARQAVARRLSDGASADDLRWLVSGMVRVWSGTKWAPGLRVQKLLGDEYDKYCGMVAAREQECDTRRARAARHTEPVVESLPPEEIGAQSRAFIASLYGKKAE